MLWACECDTDQITRLLSDVTHGCELWRNMDDIITNEIQNWSTIIVEPIWQTVSKLFFDCFVFSLLGSVLHFVSSECFYALFYFIYLFRLYIDSKHKHITVEIAYLTLCFLKLHKTRQEVIISDLIDFDSNGRPTNSQRSIIWSLAHSE